MTNLKKIGLTALAGTLAATTFAQAGELTASGTARMEYQSNETTTSSCRLVQMPLHKTQQYLSLVQVKWIMVGM